MAWWTDSDSDSDQEFWVLHNACVTSARYFYNCMSYRWLNTEKNLPKDLYLEYRDYECHINVKGFNSKHGFDTLAIAYYYPRLNEWDDDQKSYASSSHSLFQLTLGERDVYIDSLGYGSPNMPVFFTDGGDRTFSPIFEEIRRLYTYYLYWNTRNHSFLNNEQREIITTLCLINQGHPRNYEDNYFIRIPFLPNEMLEMILSFLFIREIGQDHKED